MTDNYYIETKQVQRKREMKVILDYDQSTGSIKDKDGLIVATWSNLNCEKAEKKAYIDELIKLKEAGFTVEDIVELRRKEIF